MKTYFPAEIGPYKRRYILGSGSQSQVWLYKKEGDKFAVKNDAGQIKIPKHKNICKTIEIISIGKDKWVVSEYLGNISIFELVEKKPIPEEKAIEWFIQVCEAISFAHKKGIAHCDIKCENVMIYKDVPKIIDWGFACSLKLPGTGYGSMEYCSPEVFKENSEKRDLKACDVWSLGVLFFCMLFSFFPFHGRNKEEFLKSTKTKRHVKKLSEKHRDFFLWIFRTDPEKRPKLKDILERLNSQFLLG